MAGREAERTARRVLSLWLPRLPTDAHGRRHPERRDHPLAAILAERGRLGVAAVNRAAEEAGVWPGMSLADARAIEPALAVFDAAPGSDARLLERIAGWCTRYTPWTAPDGPDGVALDITGCAHLFGGEEAMAADLSARLAAAGFESRLAVADTPAAAWALTRFGRGAPTLPLRGSLPPPLRRGGTDSPLPCGAGEGRGGGKGFASPLLSPLSVAALRLPAATVEGLAAVGLRRIGDLHAVPRATLAARFGPELLRRLDQAYGRLDEPLSPRLPVPPHSARLALPEPLTTADAIAEALRRLLATLCAGLEKTGEGARRLRLELHRVDRRLEDAPQTLAIGTGHPVRRPDALMRLFAQKLDRVEPGPGLELMVLSATEAGPLAATQAALDGAADGGADGQPELGELMDRLGNRLGERAVLRLVPRQSWLPERSVAPASAFAPVLAGTPGASLWPADRPRPVRLLAPPEPIEAMAPVPDDPPVMFRWRGVQHRVRRADGPERIEAEWWRRDGEPRDYYRVEDEAGRRFWVFRQGLYRPGVTVPWFLHGFFG
ncbi:DNA polymerase [Azospirillum sp. TSH58]|uniref:Y-family DNA polymerase n=1 Tax=Azospirillum sp. TSH58 TaxID=664962 RepID=UPI000D603042|nr:DNA polymerase Y family protein [Azospirillum sp. TSH58]AWJ85362.1 DNA polymerase [Azospirillum sp. TSH58]PWC68942.1 DNA polymerase [Azospirillum sp. TSH58]